ncbi:MAG: hypothetical protein APR63_05605 [Desulfuromonas sp. SDB]|nr:MAG: hypothetical protein APR63_05605 [Desulfuromonas sp. SDB]
MKKTLLLLILICAAGLIAASDGPCGEAYITASAPHTPDVPEMTGVDYSGNVYNPEFSEQELIELSSNGSFIPYAPLWADDILVTDQCNLSIRYDMGFDYDDNGYLYAAILSSSTANDTIHVFRSTDRGYTWDLVYSLWFSIGNPVRIFDFDFRVSHNDADPDYHFAWVDSCYTTQSRRLWYGRVPIAGGTNYWNMFDTAAIQTRYVNKLTMDINELTDPNVVITFTNTLGQWRSAVTTNQGTSWDYYYHYSAGGPSYPFCAFGDGTHFHCAAILADHNSSIRLRNGTTSGGYSYAWLNDTLVNQTRSQLHLSADKMTAHPNYHVVAVWRQNDANYYMYQNVSTDAGSNWGTEGVISAIGAVYSANPFFRFGQNSYGVFTCIDYQYTDDSLFCCLYSPTSGNWYSAAYINNHRPTGLLPAYGTYVSPNNINGRVVIYRQYAANPIWFDRWNYASTVEEQPIAQPVQTNAEINYNSDQVNILFTLSTASDVSIKVYDALGRLVRTIEQGYYLSGNHNLTWDLQNNQGHQVCAGSYFVNIQLGNSTFTKSVNIF